MLANGDQTIDDYCLGRVNSPVEKRDKDAVGRDKGYEQASLEHTNWALKGEGGLTEERVSWTLKEELGAGLASL